MVRQEGEWRQEASGQEGSGAPGGEWAGGEWRQEASGQEGSGAPGGEWAGGREVRQRRPPVLVVAHALPGFEEIACTAATSCWYCVNCDGRLEAPCEERAPITRPQGNQDNQR